MARARIPGLGPQDQSGGDALGEGGGDQSGIFKQVSNPGDIAGQLQDEAPGFEVPELGGQGAEADVHRRQPLPMDPIEAKSGESPRERGALGAQASLRRPSTPTPMSGSTFSPGMGQGLMPFQPLDQAEGSTLTNPQGSLFGSAGGLKGGGLGVPLDPTSNQQSDPIAFLMRLLKGQGQ